MLSVTDRVQGSENHCIMVDQLVKKAFIMNYIFPWNYFKIPKKLSRFIRDTERDFGVFKRVNKWVTIT